MIISASRRTDIPSYYSKWFLNRLHEGFVYVRNPMNHKQVSKISLSKKDVECIVFWTKNPYPLMQNLDALKAYNYYFQFTLTPYGQNIEVNLPPKKELVPVFKKLASKIGKERVIWRYDPVLLTQDMDVKLHLDRFQLLCDKLKEATDECVFSFLEQYPSINKRMAQAGCRTPNKDQALKIAQGMAQICESNNIKLSTCSESVDLSHLNIGTSKCIDDQKIKHLFNLEGHIPKDPNQRKTCGCVKSIDIGGYNTCKHGCVYCYANHYKKTLEPESLKAPILTGSVDDSCKITDRKVDHYFSKQISLFNDPF